MTTSDARRLVSRIPATGYGIPGQRAIAGFLEKQATALMRTRAAVNDARMRGTVAASSTLFKLSVSISEPASPLRINAM